MRRQRSTEEDDDDDEQSVVSVPVMCASNEPVSQFVVRSNFKNFAMISSGRESQYFIFKKKNPIEWALGGTRHWTVGPLSTRVSAFVLYPLECRAVAQLSKPGQGRAGRTAWKDSLAEAFAVFHFHCDAALHMLLSQSLLASFKNRCECDTARDEAGIDSRPSDDDDQQVLVHGTQ